MKHPIFSTVDQITTAALQVFGDDESEAGKLMRLRELFTPRLDKYPNPDELVGCSVIDSHGRRGWFLGEDSDDWSELVPVLFLDVMMVAQRNPAELTPDFGSWRLIFQHPDDAQPDEVNPIGSSVPGGKRPGDTIKTAAEVIASVPLGTIVADCEGDHWTIYGERPYCGSELERGGDIDRSPDQWDTFVDYAPFRVIRWGGVTTAPLTVAKGTEDGHAEPTEPDEGRPGDDEPTETAEPSGIDHKKSPGGRWDSATQLLREAPEGTVFQVSDGTEFHVLFGMAGSASSVSVGFLGGIAEADFLQAYSPLNIVRWGSGSLTGTVWGALCNLTREAPDGTIIHDRDGRVWQCLSGIFHRVRTEADGHGAPVGCGPYRVIRWGWGDEQ